MHSVAFDHGSTKMQNFEVRSNSQESPSRGKTGIRHARLVIPEVYEKHATTQAILTGTVHCHSVYPMDCDGTPLTYLSEVRPQLGARTVSHQM